MRRLASVILALAIAVPVSAAPAAPGKACPVMDSASAERAAEDSPAVLEGVLIRQLTDDMYIFEDASGDIIVEIDDDLMKGHAVSPVSRVRLCGLVEKDGGITYVDVDTLEVLD